MLLDQIDALSAQTGILAEIGLDMTRFPPPGTWCRGPSSARAPSSPGRRTAPARPARAILTSRASSARPPRMPPGPAPSWANGTGGWSSGSASSRPGRRRPLHPGHHLAPAVQSRRPVLRTRLRLPRQPHRHRAQGTRPHPPAPSPRLHRHPHPGSLTRTTHAQTRPHSTGQGSLPRARRTPHFSGSGSHGICGLGTVDADVLARHVFGVAVHKGRGTIGSLAGLVPNLCKAW